MGDVIVTAPLIATLHEQYPDAFIGLLTRRQYAGLFNDDVRLSALYTVNKKECCADIGLMERVWDLIIDLQHNHQSTAQIARLHHLSTSVFNKLHFERTLLLLLRINRYPAAETVASRYIKVAFRTDAGNAPDFRIPFGGYDARTFRRKVRNDEFERPVIALFPFSAWKNKEWGDRSFISIGQFFSIKGWRVVLLGGPSDRDRASRMQRIVGRQCFSFAGEMSLYECGSLLSHCNLALGCDSGLAHLARACGVKTGFIFGPTTIHFGFQPQDDTHSRIFETRHFCRPCHPHGGNLCWRLNHVCMRSITPENVIYGLLDLFHGK